MSPALTTREIDDVGDTVLSFSEAKALATGNPLLMDKTAADAELARLVRAERAHYRNQDTLSRTVTRLKRNIADLTQSTAQLDLAIARRRDTRGESFSMTIEGGTYRKRADAGLKLLTRLRREAANQLGSRERTLDSGELGGFSLTSTISRPFDTVHVRVAFEGAPGAEIAVSAADLAELDPVGLISRLEHRLSRLDASKAQTLTDMDRARSEIDHAQADLGKPWPQLAELAAARDRVRHIDEQLQAAAAPPHPVECPEREAG